MKTLLFWVGVLAGLAFIVGLASRASPIVIYSSENGEAEGVQFSWPLIVGLLVACPALMWIGIRDEYKEE